MLRAGDKAPAFALKDHTGKEVKLDDLKGKRVVLWFYPKADTPGCTMEGCGFRDLAAEFAKKNAAIYGISYDAPAANAAFVTKFRFTFPLLSDTDAAVAKAYGAFDPKEPGYPQRHTFVIGADGKIEKALEKVNPKTHPKALLDGL